MAKTAVLIPCYNEAITISQVVHDFRRALPDATIYVYDNNSTDNTSQVAREAGALVVSAPKQGKGNVVRQMFDEVDADLYVMIDGDDTYPVASAPELITALQNGVDMVVGTRLKSFSETSFRRFHHFGNRLVACIISLLFSTSLTDIMSGYRVLSRKYVKSVPLRSKGFEIETEMTLQALAKDFAIREIPIKYGERKKGSHSKLRTFRDGIFILKSIFMIFKDYKPLIFFSFLGMIFALTSLVSGYLPIMDYITERYVSHVPLAILAAGTGILAVLCFSIGLILDTLSRYQKENFEMTRRLLNK